MRVEGWRIWGWIALVGALAAIGYAGRAVDGAPPDDVLYRYDTAVGAVLLYGVLLLLVLLVAAGLPRREVFALRRSPSWAGGLGWALLAFVTIFIGAGVLGWALDAGDEQGLTPDAWDSSKAGAYAANFVAVAFVGPLVEELLYRGAGVTFLSQFGSGATVVITAIAFGLGHGLLLALPAFVFFGLVTALLRLRTRSVYPCIGVHSAFNAASLVLAVAV
jgi:membrane protease YdiL (CAAX protease family)